MLGDRRGVRILVLVVFVGLQIGLFLHYGQHAEQCPPDVECLATDYEQHIGETWRVGGTVVTTSPPTIAIDYAPGERLRLQLTNLPFAVQRGELVAVYGELRPNQTIAVQDAVKHPVGNQYYMYAISALAVVGVTVLGLRDWRFDPTTFTFRRRDR